MPTLIVKSIGLAGENKVLLETSHELKQIIQDHRDSKPRPDDYKTPTTDEYVQLSVDKRMLSMIKLGTEQKIILKVCDYEFDPNKDTELSAIARSVYIPEMKRGCFVKLMAVLV